MRIIKRREVVEDAFRRVTDDEALPIEGDVIVSLDRFEAERESLVRRAGRIGVRVSTDVDLDRLGATLPVVDAITVELLEHTDGRAYSTARLLRERHGFRGELRAVGKVYQDQLFYLARCGFDAFELAPGKDPSRALRAFTELTETYQPGADEALPLWRRARRWQPERPVEEEPQVRLAAGAGRGGR